MAEDAVQDAVVAALEAWPRTGTPDNPGAWLTTVARRRALDRIRRESARRTRELAAIVPLLADESNPPPNDDSMVRDDVLRLIFTCCHPALSLDAQVALTLRTVCQLATRDIAAAFLVPEPTMGQRISRAKKKIAVARIPYRVPADHELSDRLSAVLSVVYLVFTAGHHASSTEVVVRVELTSEAIRLARLLADLVPDEPEVSGLLALMLSTDARSKARVDAAGDIVLMSEQRRELWDRDAIDEAATLIDHTLRRRRPGPYQVQAAISCLHGLATTWEQTDWPQILDLYDLLVTMTPTPAVRLNRAVAIAEVHGPHHALNAIAHLTGLEEWHLYWSTQADFLRRVGQIDAAIEAYAHALACGSNDADSRFIQRRLDECRTGNVRRQ